MQRKETFEKGNRQPTRQAMAADNVFYLTIAHRVSEPGTIPRFTQRL